MGGLLAHSETRSPSHGHCCRTEFGTFGLFAGNKSATAAFSVDAYLGTNESGIENIVFAERRPLTTEEVLATIINRDEREAGR